MSQLNSNRGIVKAKKNNNIIVQLPRGGTFTFKTDRKFKVGDPICFTLDTVLNKVIEVLPQKDADSIVDIADNEAWGALMDDGLESIDLEDDDIGYDEQDEEDFLDLITSEEINDEYTISDTSSRQLSEGGINRYCGENGEDVIDPADYFAEYTQP